MNLLLDAGTEVRQALIDVLGVPAAVIEFDGDEKYRVVAMNRLAARFYGVPDDLRHVRMDVPSIMAVSGASEDLAREFVNRTHEVYRRVRETRETVATEHATVRGDGQVVWSRNTTEPVMRRTEIACLFSVNIDITEAMEAQADIEKNLNQLVGQHASVCESCSRIQNRDGRWLSLEAFTAEAGNIQITHGMCPGCSDKWTIS